MYAVVQTQQIGDPHQGTSLPNPVVIDSRHDGGLVPFMGPTKFNTRLHFHLLRIYRFYTSIRHRYTRLCIYIYICIYRHRQSGGVLIFIKQCNVVQCRVVQCGQRLCVCLIDFNLSQKARSEVNGIDWTECAMSLACLLIPLPSAAFVVL